MHDKRKIYFRADAGPEIGYGHYIRSLALADMLKQDFDCTMFTLSPTEYQLREAAEICKVIALPADDTRFNKFLDYLTGEEIVVLDNYFFTTDYQRSIKGLGCRLICIDDMHDKHYVADIVINQAPGLVYEDFNIEPYTQLCTGFNWSLLRRPFLETTESNPRNGCFVCMGGADFYNLSEIITDALLSATNDDIFLVVGDINKQNAIIKKKYENNKRVHLFSSLTALQMANLMRRVCYGIVPSSGLLWESYMCNLPVLYGYYIDNQKEICERNPQLYKMSFSVGDLRKYDETQWISLIRSFRESLLNQSDKKLALHNNIRNNYINLFSQRITIRLANLNDCEIYYEWANDPIVRAMSFSNKSIAYFDHVTWFTNKLNSSSSYMYICYSFDKPIGQVRYDIENQEALIDISVDSRYRGLSFGKEILLTTLNDFVQNQPNVTIFAEVLQINLPSQHLFESCGFKFINQNNKRKLYEFCNCIGKNME